MNNNKTNIVGLGDLRETKPINTGTPQKNVKSRTVHKKVKQTKRRPQLNRVAPQKSYAQQIIELANGII